MEFLIDSTLVDRFHYTNNIKAKQEGKPCFTIKTTGQTFDKKEPAEYEKSRQPSQPTPPNPDHGKKHSQKEKREHRKEPPTRKWCDYHNSSWHDTPECKAQKTCLEKLLNLTCLTKPQQNMTHKP